MSFPYITDIANALLGMRWALPIPTFGVVVAAVFAVLLVLRSEAQRPAYLFSVYLIFAGFERLLIEKLRMNPEHDWLGIQLTQAEAISVVFCCGRPLWRTSHIAREKTMDASSSRARRRHRRIGLRTSMRMTGGRRHR
jgi:hypothetical protein